ncbi:spore coat associated protein CotJA [uncultured Clostridium sp.]|uniref:spore coat associated protein CotJA n=2 Tax=uncultured Clostridium sp. TaxID=59620 RepID=UPI0025E3102C|nr:spore coat associated protein CotJA [uncultured Clostridium sp.]
MHFKGKELNKMNQYDRCKEREMYAEAYVIPQKYCNLLDPTDALFYGTIFKDLIRPYRRCKIKKKSCYM